MATADLIIRGRGQGRRRQKQREVWVKPWPLRGPLFGQYQHSLVELNQEDPRGYKKKILRVTSKLLTELVERVRSHKQKKDPLSASP